MALGSIAFGYRIPDPTLACVNQNVSQEMDSHLFRYGEIHGPRYLRPNGVNEAGHIKKVYFAIDDLSLRSLRSIGSADVWLSMKAHHPPTPCS